MEANENEKTTVQTLWDAAKAVLRGKYIAVKAYLKKQEESQRQNLTAHLKEPEAEQGNPKPSRRSEVNKDQSRNKQYRIQKEKKSSAFQSI